MTHDPTRDCEHGRLKGKCDVCDLQTICLYIIYGTIAVGFGLLIAFWIMA
jgi:hypothetical protein